MNKDFASRSGIFTPRVLVAFALCSFGVLLGMFSLAATTLSELESSPSRKPVEATRANTGLPPDSANFLSRSGSNANRLPPGVPLPPSGLDAPPGRKPGTQFSLNGQGDPSSSSPTAGFPPPGRKPSGLDAPPGWKPGTGGRANSLGNPVFANQQPAQLSLQQPAASESMPLASGAQSGWSIVTSPNASGTPLNELYSVTCASASDCWAVGDYWTGSAYQTLIERWNGTSWAVVTSPNSGTVRNSFSGVTCVSASDCWAVGYHYSGSGVQTLVERWDGTAWAIVTSPNTLPSPYNFLNGVTCASASDCWAVGYYYSFSANTRETLIERWNGTSWAVVTSPNTSAGQDNFLNGVTCTSASDCWTAGYFTATNALGSAKQTLIERWNGTAWAIVTSPNFLPAQTQDNVLTGLTCAAASNCWAVGYYYNGSVNQTLIERWDGTAWAIVTSPNTLPTQYNVLSEVTCASASDCWAVGDWSSGSDSQTLIERWDGTSWAIVTSPNSTALNYLAGVTCVSGSDCWAVGQYNAGIANQTFTERWDGTAWAIVTSPNASGNLGNFLFGVTCVSGSDCWAVGYYYTASAKQTLIERWDGTSWAVVTSPNTLAAQNNVLTGVTCASASDCLAVGNYYNGTASQTLAERWDGTSWVIVTSANTLPTQDNFISGVTCTSTSDCWAVGYSSNPTSGVGQTLIERWDGTSWAIVTSPNTSTTQSNYLSGVTCASAASDCWAVGYSANGGAIQTLIEQWDGTSWAIVTSPNISGNLDNVLFGVTCVSASGCWAIGYSAATPLSAPQALIERWNGISWTIVASAQQGSILSGVTCVSASDCWAVGANIEQWDGKSWTIVSSPNTGVLFNVACVSTSDCWAVGYYLASNGYQTLIEKYALTIPPLTGVVSRMTHGSAGTFDIDLPLTSRRGVECRSGGTNGNYTMVFTFVNNLTSVGSVSTSGGSVSSSALGPNLNQYTVSLTGVIPPNPPGGEYITVTLNNVLDSQNNTGTVAATMGVLIGDVNASGLVDGNDVSAVQGHTRQVPNGTTFRLDVNTSGLIDGNDVSLVQSKTRTSLPSPP